MNKRNIIIISSVAGLFLLSLALYLMFGRTAKPEVSNASPTPSTSDQPLFGNTGDGTGTNPLFTGTSDPNANPGSDITITFKGLCSDQWSGQADSDGDGLPDSVETIYKTDPANPDTDSDGYKDGDEVKNGYDPMSSGSARLDSDNDGLTDDQECVWKTDAFNADTDKDSHNDGNEVANGYNPILKGDGKGSDKLGITPAPTPTPGGLVIGEPTPTSEPGETTPANTPTTKPTTSPTLEMVKRSELKVSSSAGKAAIQKYLADVDKASPSDLIENSQLSDALTSAFKGNASKLLPIITGLKQHEQLELAISTPEVAVTHQTLLVSLTRFVIQQLTTIAENAGKSIPQQYNAALEIQKKLSTNMTLLGTERQKLETLAK